MNKAEMIDLSPFTFISVDVERERKKMSPHITIKDH